MNKRYIWLGIAVLLLIIGGFYLYQKVHIQTSSSIPTTTYYCQEGILKAQYGTNNVVLTFADGSNILLPQVVSGSGIRYALGSTTFSSEGSDAFLTEGTSTTYTNCVSGTETINQATSTYTDSANTFSFAYPNQFVLSGGDIGYSQDWSYINNNADLGILFTRVYIPKSFMPQTNFGEAKFTVGTSVDPDAIKNCLISPYGGMGSTTQVTINNQLFTKITFTDAGAGQRYEITSYRTIKNNQCYVIEYSIHYSIIDNYPKELGIKVFDDAKITSVLESMAQSFHFL
jgi:membrane-bound inhibitor of C-type lysozyme